MKKRCILIFFCVLILFLGLTLWTWQAERKIRYTPDYQQLDLQPYIKKDQLTQEDYALLFQQTGLSAVVIQDLLEKAGPEELLRYQKSFFEKPSYQCRFNSCITKEERRVIRKNETGACIPIVEEGDILITFSCHVFGWRNGHAGIVVDAERKQVLEARVLGTDSTITNLSTWETYPGFALLRLKGASLEERQRIAAQAKKHLINIPYALGAGLFQKETRDIKKLSQRGTQCAHLVWSAYYSCGYDLDSDGGNIVTPKDLFDSDLLEAVQIYGMNPSLFLEK